MSNTQVAVRFDPPWAAVTLSTAGGINILSSSVLKNIRDAVQRIREEPGVRYAVFSAEGKVFVAGADIKEMAGFSSADARAYGALGQETFGEISRLRCITVAAINGAAMGGGLELALACDFRVAVKSAKLSLPEVTLGLIPGWGGIGRLTKLVGSARAGRLFLGGSPISAEEGVAWGLIDEVVNSAEDLLPRVTAFCKGFSKGSPAAVALAKRAAADGDDLAAFADCFAGEESREGIAAFLEKRPTRWSN
jgi:enoyl-CoA hydratase